MGKGQLHGTGNVSNLSRMNRETQNVPGTGTRLCPQVQPQRVEGKERARVKSHAPFTGDPLRLGFATGGARTSVRVFPAIHNDSRTKVRAPKPPAMGRDGAPRRPRPRSSGRNQNAHDVTYASRCTAERGADGASAPSLPNARRKRIPAQAPKSKPQAPKKFQTPNIKHRPRVQNWSLVLGASLELGCWCLELFTSTPLCP